MSHFPRVPRGVTSAGLLVCNVEAEHVCCSSQTALAEHPAAHPTNRLLYLTSSNRAGPSQGGIISLSETRACEGDVPWVAVRSHGQVDVYPTKR